MARNGQLPNTFLYDPMKSSRKIALVGPSFFSYIEAIRSHLAKRGLQSEFFDERHSNGILVKILYRIGFYSIFTSRKNRHLDSVAARIVMGQFDDVLLIDVEVCDTRFVKQLVSAGVRVYLYMWDSAKNKPRYLSYLGLLHGKSSFDPEDCSRHNLTYIPLFAEDVFSARLRGLGEWPNRPVDVAFCGTLHSNRAERITDLLGVAGRNGLTVSLLLYFHSRLLLLLKSAFRVSNARFVSSILTTGFSKQDIYELFAQSKFVFDLPHPGQVGLTARTFEALRSGTRLITFNRAAHSMLPPTFAERILIIDSASDLEHINWSEECPSSMLSEHEDYYLSLDRFVDQVLELMHTSEPVSEARCSHDAMR
jgi:hypothetical protein